MRIVTFRAIAVFYRLVNRALSILSLMTLVTNIAGGLDRCEFVFRLAFMAAGAIADSDRAMNKFILAHAAVALVGNTRVPGSISNSVWTRHNVATQDDKQKNPEAEEDLS